MASSPGNKKARRISGGLITGEPRGYVMSWAPSRGGEFISQTALVDYVMGIAGTLSQFLAQVLDVNF